MNKNLKFIIYCVCFVAFILLAVWGYDYLSNNYYDSDTNQDNIQNSGDADLTEISEDSELNNSENQEQNDEHNQDSDVDSSVKAIDFEVLNRDGEVVKLSDFYGKPIVVNFWATWCGPCSVELPDFEEAYKKYAGEVEFLMVNLTDGYSDTISSVEKFVADNDYDFPVYFDTTYSASDAYEVYSIPQTIFIDKDANIVASYIGTINENVLESNILQIDKK